MKIAQSLILTFILLSNFSLKAQDYFEEASLKEAIQLSESGAHKEAYNMYKRLLSSGGEISAEFPYYFAKNLYDLKKYNNSLNFLQQYLTYHDSEIRHKTEAIQLERKIGQAMSVIQSCPLCDKSGFLLVPCDYCEGNKTIDLTCQYCQGKGIELCKKCDGEGVVISRNAFNENNYTTCDRCKGQGFHGCSHCEGKKIMSKNCPECLGSGDKKSATLCTHQTESHDH